MAERSRIAVVTGAGKGLGAAFATALAQDGCHLVVNNRTHAGIPSSARHIAQAIQNSRGVAIHQESPVDAPDAATTIINDTIAHFGGLDILVLNAGISGPALKVGGEADTKLRDVMEINFFSNASLVEAALPYLQASKAGRILLIGSSAGLYGVRGRAAYAASKGALIAYGKTLADELRRSSIRVNMLAPYAATSMTAGEGGATDPQLGPDKATAAAVWLCRPDCDRTGDVWVTGANHAARATTIEGAGGTVPDGTADGFERNLSTLASIDGGQEHDGAQTAFAAFMSRVSQSPR